MNPQWTPSTQTPANNQSDSNASPAEPPPTAPTWQTHQSFINRNFSHIILIFLLIFVALPAIGALLAGISTSKTSSVQADSNFFLMSALVFWAIIWTVALTVVWIIHKVRNRKREEMSQDSASAIYFSQTMNQKDVSAQNRSVNFLFKIGLIFFGITLFGLVSAFPVVHSFKLASNLPVWYGVFSIFATPIINMVGIGLVLWALATLNQSTKKFKLYLSVVLCLSPILIWAGFAVVLSKKPALLIKPTHSSATNSQFSDLPFTPLLPSGISNYRLNPNQKIATQDVNGTTIANIFLTFQNNDYYGQNIYELAAGPKYTINKNTKQCYPLNRSVASIGCNYAYTTSDGTDVMVSSENDAAGDTILTYYFQKAGTYAYFELGGAVGSVTNGKDFINSLQPAQQ